VTDKKILKVDKLNLLKKLQLTELRLEMRDLELQAIYDSRYRSEIREKIMQQTKVNKNNQPIPQTSSKKKTVSAVPKQKLPPLRLSSIANKLLISTQQSTNNPTSSRTQSNDSPASPLPTRTSTPISPPNQMNNTKRLPALLLIDQGII
jgi:hypothetical protein